MSTGFCQYFLRLIRLTILGLLVSHALVANGVVLTGNDDRVNLAPYAEVLVDKSGKLTWDEIREHPDRYAFAPVPAGANRLSLGFTDAVYWIRLDLARAPDVAGRWILEIPFVTIDRVELFTPTGQSYSSGTMSSTSDRQIFSRVPSFYLDLSTKPQAYFLRVQSSYPLTVPLDVMQTDVFGRSQLVDTMVQFLYFGGLLSLFLYNLVIYLTNRDHRYLFYCIFAVFVGFGMFAGNGYGRLFLWPDSTAFDRVSQGMFFGMASTFGLLFTIEFLELRQRTRHAFWVLSLLLALNFLIALGLLLGAFVAVPVASLYFLNITVSTLSIVVCVGVAGYLASQGFRQAHYLTISWGVLTVGAFVATLRAFDVIPSNVLTMYAVQIGSGFEALFFSFALADRLRTERVGRESAQKRLLQSQQETLSALKVSEERLEQAVDIRTQELRAMLVKEQQARDQYVRFGSMIAHEFRNPLNVIEAQNALMELDPQASEEKVTKRVGVIRSAVTRLSGLFDQWLQSDRLSQAFAKISPLPIDVAGLIDDVANVSRTYQPDHEILVSITQSPLVVRADYALLRIATLNLVDNACKYSAKGTTVYIGVECRGDWVGLFVKDQGAGIAPEKQEEIFEPYVQLPSDERLVGVGLGLSFVKRITQLHDGKIELQSQVGQGSTFTLWIKRHVDT